MVPNTCDDGAVYDADAGACCRTCAKGQGVALPCTGIGSGNDTVCMHCVDGVTYSSSVSHEESCQPCSHCPLNAQAVHRCNATHNTKCECVDGFWYDAEKRSCSKCAPCQAGHEASRACAPYQNTHCRPCAKGYYSDSYGYSTQCRLCSLCKAGQLVRTACSASRDTECVDAKALLNGMGSTDTPVVSGVNLFPVYCAVPAVVLVSLVLFVIFKRRKQFSCSRRPPCKAPGAFKPHGPVPVATSASIVKEHKKFGYPSSGHGKRHSGCTDGTCSCCSKALEPMLLTADSPVQCLPTEIVEQLEKKLTGPNDGEQSGWIALAKQLGCGDAKIQALVKEATVSRFSLGQLFLQDWSYRLRVTVRVLADALESVGYLELASMLRRDIDVSAKVNNNSKTLISGPVHFV